MMENLIEFLKDLADTCIMWGQTYHHKGLLDTIRPKINILYVIPEIKMMIYINRWNTYLLSNPSMDILWGMSKRRRWLLANPNKNVNVDELWK